MGGSRKQTLFNCPVITAVRILRKVTVEKRRSIDLQSTQYRKVQNAGVISWDNLLNTTSSLSSRHFKKWNMNREIWGN